MENEVALDSNNPDRIRYGDEPSIDGHLGRNTVCVCVICTVLLRGCVTAWGAERVLLCAEATRSPDHIITDCPSKPLTVSSPLFVIRLWNSRRAYTFLLRLKF